MMNPYSPGERGPKPELSEEDRTKRNKLLRLKAAYESKKRKLLSQPNPNRVREIELDEHIAKVMYDIAQIGGVPKSWMKEVMDGQLR